MAGHSVTVRIDGDTRDFEKQLKNLGAKTQAGLADIKAGIDLTSAAAKSLFNIAAEGVKYTAGIEQLQTSFEVMTGSAEKAAEVVNRLRTMGAETPFETADLAATTQLLMQYGFTADDAIEQMRMLGDVAQGNKEALSSIALGYAQMSSAQKVNLQDIKQMINGGFNPLQEISERTGESMGSLYERISKGTMSVDEITASLRAATSEGGKFFGSMEKQSQTLNGRLSTLKDNAKQLLGSLTVGVTDELRDELLPLADNMIGALQEGFDARGMEGLLDAATGMLPDLLNMMTGRMEDSIESLQKFAPKAVQGIMRSIPGAIRSGSAVLPQITAALFETAGFVVNELVTMLPELTPVLAEGFANMAISVVSGMHGLVHNLFAGFGNLMKEAGLLQRSVDEAFNTAFDDIDKKRVAALKNTVNIDIDTSITTNDYTTEITSVYDGIKAALTDGAPDTETITTDIETDVRGMFSGMTEKINTWKSEELAKLDKNLPTEEYEAQVTAINAKADELIAKQQELEAATATWLEENAGKSTATVKEHLGELDSIYNRVVELQKNIDELTGSEQTAAESRRTLVQTGAVSDQSIQLESLILTKEEYAAKVKAAQTEVGQALNDAAEQFANDADAYSEKEKEILTGLDSKEAALYSDYENNLIGVLEGIAQNIANESPDVMQRIADAYSAMDLSGLMQQLISQMQTGEVTMSETEMQSIADALGKPLETLQKQISQGIALGDTSATESELASAATNLFDDAEAAVNDAVNDLDLSGAGTVLQAAIEEGVFADVEGMETTTPADMLKNKLLEIAQSGSDGFSEGLGGKESEATTAGEELGQAGADGAGNTAPWTASANNTTDALLRSLRARKAELRKVGAEMGIAVNTGYNNAMQIKSPSRVMMQAGRYTGEGLEIGLRESMEKAVATAKSITGELTTGASFRQISFVGNMPNLQQEIALANEQNPVNLYVNGRQLGQVMASDTNRAQNAYNRSIALGVGK